MRWAALVVSLALAGCSRDMAVPAMRPLTLTPGATAIAPRQRIAFAAAGGASGYRFAFSGLPGSGSDAELDPATGAYRAGSSGPGTDVVVVTDQAGATATATVTVGAMLTISPQIALAAPGGSATFTAAGGLPPYAFSFQHKGNRSGGRIDGVTGEYTAGPNPGTQDEVVVVDAAGAFAVPASPIYVGAVHLPLPGGATELELADLNGDGRKDVVSLEPATATGTRRLTTTMLLPGGAQVSETYFTTGGSISGGGVLAGVGRADVFSAFQSSSPASLYLPDASGHLVVESTFSGAAAARLPYVVGYSGFTGCTGGSGLYRLDWNTANAAFDPAACVTAVSQRDLSHLGDLAAGRFEADVGATSVAWLERDTYTGPFYLTGTPQLHYATQTPRLLPVPAGLSAVLPTGGFRQQLVAGNLRGTGATDTAVLLANGATTRNLLFVVPSFTSATAPAWAGTSFDPFPGGPPALGVARCPPVPGTAQETLATWNGTLKAEVVAVDASGTPSASSAHVSAVYVPITVAACGDVNGDGVPDLVLASDSTSTMAVLWGDGDGGFGRRPYFQSTPAFTAAQVDGDGVGDVVVATEQPSLVTYLGDAHELARVAETPLTFAAAGIWAGDLGGATVPGWAGDLVVADTSSNLYVALGSPAGTFGRPASLLDAPAASGRIPRIVRVAFAELGGGAAGLDVVVLYELKPYGTSGTIPVSGSYELDAIVRPASGAPQVARYTFDSNGGADVQPADVDGDGVDELVLVEGYVSGAGSVKRLLPYRLRVDAAGGTMSQIGNVPWVDPGTLPLGLPPVAAGRFGDQAVFTNRTVLALFSGAGADPTYAVTTLPGGLAAPYPAAMGNVTAPGPATLATVSPLSPVPALVFSDAAGVHVLPGTLAAGKLAGFGPGVTGAAPGVFAATLPQGASTGSDVLVFTGEELIPLVWSGSVLR